MNNRNKVALAFVLASATIGGSSVAVAELTTELGVVSNYVWRGQTQTDDGAALQGGLEYLHDTGLYAGAWASNVDDGVESGIEYDLYAGFANEVGEFGYDIAYLTYNFTNDDYSDALTEYKLGLSYGAASLAWFTDDDSTYDYFDAGLEFELPEKFAIGLHYGVVDYDAVEAGDDTTVWDYSIGVSKSFGAVRLGISYIDHEQDNGLVMFGIASEMEF